MVQFVEQNQIAATCSKNGFQLMLMKTVYKIVLKYCTPVVDC